MNLKNSQTKSQSVVDKRSQGEQNVKPLLIDTDILSMFFRKHSEVTARFVSYLAQYKKMNISIITYYEIMSGLKHRDAHRRTALFIEFVSGNKVLPLRFSCL